MDHVGELIFFMRGNKVANKEHVERTRRKMKESMMEQFKHQRQRSHNFTFEELLSFTHESLDECVEQSPVSNYENIFSPMSLVADSPLPSINLYNSRKRHTTDGFVNSPTGEVSEESLELNDSGVQVDLIQTSTPKRAKLTR